jgi:hypothetical protein
VAPERVEGEQEISLNAVRYRITRPIQSFVSSVYPPKVVIGDQGRDTQQRLSVVTWSDWRGGIGLDTMEGNTGVNRAWITQSMDMRHPGHLVLGPLINGMTGEPAGQTLGAIGSRAGVLYFAWSTDIYSSSNGTSMANTNFNVPAAATDAITFRLGDIEYIGFCCDSSGFIYFNGTRWFMLPDPAKYATFWDDKLYLIDSTGQLKQTADLTSKDSEAGGAYTVTETAGSARLEDAAQNFSGYKAGGHVIVLRDGENDMLYGYIGSGGTNTQVNVFNSAALTTQNWIGDTSDFGTIATYDVLLETTADAQLPLPDDHVSDLLVYPNASNDPIVYATTIVGLYGHDSGNTKFVATGLGLPRHPDNGKGSVVWRDSLYIPSGLTIYKYQINNSSAVVSSVGLDRDDGLHSTEVGPITSLVATQNEIIATVGGSTTGDADNATPDIYSWDSLGWQNIALGEGAGGGNDTIVMYVSDDNNAYRLYWGVEATVRYIDLPRLHSNPKRITSYNYGAGGVLYTPWFTGGQAEVSKLAIRLRVDAQDMTSDETLTIARALDYTGAGNIGTFSTLGSAITSSGVTTFDFPNSTTPTGTEFRAIRFRIVAARGSTTTLSPDLLAMTLEYRKKLDVKYGHTFEVDLSEEYGGRSVNELRAALISALETATLVEFTFRSDSGDTRNYYVDVTSLSGMENTGFDERGTATVSVVEA